MPTPKPRKKLRPRGSARVKRSASRGRGKKWILVLFVVLLLIPATQVAVVRFINPPLTLPMLIDQGSAMFSSAPKRPLRYRWISFPQIPEMFLKHLWISEDQRFFQHEGFDWKEMDLAVKEAKRKRETGSWSFHDHEPMRKIDLPLAGPLLEILKHFVFFFRLREARLMAGS